MWCAYCGEDKEGRPTVEHVFTRALGANVEPTNPFLLDVCERCNAVCGRWVDAPFVRSLVVQNARAHASKLGYDPARRGYAVPLHFIGRVTAWRDGGEQCDLWLGPTGDQIFHFHRPYPGDPPFAGRPPGVRAEHLDPGAVYARIVATNPAWHPIIGASIEANFDESTPIHLMNVALRGASPPTPSIPLARQHHATWLATIKSGQEITTEGRLDLMASERFATKLALGFGACVLGETFARSADGDLLRRSLWERDPERRRLIEVPGAAFPRTRRELAPLVGWNGCHVILAQPVDDALALATVLYSNLESTVRVTSERRHWERVIDPEGTIWVIAPGLRCVAGPMPFERYLAARDGSGRDPTFDVLAARVASAPPLPPVHLPAEP